MILIYVNTERLIVLKTTTCKAICLKYVTISAAYKRSAGLALYL